MKIYVMRHGQTNFNMAGLCNDDPVRDVHLTATGVAQAQRTAQRLARADFVRIYVSELPRTHQTAEIVNQYHHVPLVVEPLLNDIRTGFDSKPVDEYFKLTGHDRFNIVPPGGESLRQYQSRVNQFIDRVLLDDGGRADQSILVVAHEETMRVFAARFESLPDHEWEAATFANCEFQCFSTP